MPTLLRMPAIAAGAASAVLAEWQVQENIPFEKSDPIATVETEKALVEIEAEESGVILRFLVTSGAEVEVGAPIALTGVPGETVDDLDAALNSLDVGSTGPSDARGSTASTAQSESNGSTGTPPDSTIEQTRVAAAGPADPAPERLFATPLVRRIAKESELDLTTVRGTGPNRRIVRRDIEAVLADRAKPDGDVLPSPPLSVPHTDVPHAYTDVPHTRIRSAIAARLTESKRTTPHFYLRGSCRVDAMLAMRADLNTSVKVKVSVNDLIVKAAARAHNLVPQMNVVWTEHATRRFDAVDIAVAVATRGGLLTPVVRDAAQRTITAVARDLADLTQRARDGKLTQREIEGGAFCISNLGMYGTEEFSAIINPPQSAILAVGAIRREPVVEDDALAVASVMRVTLSVDHRPIDGSTAAEWMQAFVDIVENPVQILL